jgi:hypothetical protein
MLTSFDRLEMTHQLVERPAPAFFMAAAGLLAEQR